MSGFEEPNYTQTPNQFFDIYMREMGDAELRVVLAVMRYSFGYHRTAFRISLRKMTELTGLSQNGVIAGAEAAEERGLIRRIVNGKRSTTWEAITTASFDEALGLGKTASVSEAKLPQSVKKFQKTVSLDEDQSGLNKESFKERNKINIHRSVNEFIFNTRYTALNAWREAVESLAEELSYTSIQQLEGSIVTAFIPETITFKITAPNLYTRDWLDDRLKSTLIRTLTGIVGITVNVEFTSLTSSSS